MPQNISMKKWALAASFLLSILPLFAQEAESTPEKEDPPQFTLNSAIVLAIENNYDIHRKRDAILEKLHWNFSLIFLTCTLIVRNSFCLRCAGIL